MRCGLALLCGHESLSAHMRMDCISSQAAYLCLLLDMFMCVCVMCTYLLLLYSAVTFVECREDVRYGLLVLQDEHPHRPVQQARAVPDVDRGLRAT